MSIKSTWIAAAAAMLVVAGCGSQQEPATKAVAAADAALAAVKEEGAKYAPDALKEIEGHLQALHGKLDQKKYPDVLAGAPALMREIDGFKVTVAEKKKELEDAVAQAREMWPKYAEELPKMVAAVQARLKAIGKMKSLPQGVDQANVDYARKELDKINEEWTAAQADFTAGNVADAASKANTARRRASDVMTRLGVAAT